MKLPATIRASVRASQGDQKSRTYYFTCVTVDELHRKIVDIITDGRYDLLVIQPDKEYQVSQSSPIDKGATK